MPKLRVDMGGGGTKTNIYCQESVCRRCVLAVLRTVKVVVTKVGNRTKPLKDSEEQSYLEQMFKTKATVLDMQQTTVQRSPRDPKRLGCYCFYNTGNKILFRIN
jgi:hypothetical protein